MLPIRGIDIRRQAEPSSRPADRAEPSDRGLLIFARARDMRCSCRHPAFLTAPGISNTAHILNPPVAARLPGAGFNGSSNNGRQPVTDDLAIVRRTTER